MWCLERFLRGREGLLLSRASSAKASSPAACANVLTPERIPAFCIPPRPARRPAPAGPPSSWAARAAADAAGRTDWDPRSQAALSLPHLPRARTAYGFCALLESPHTRRKESLLLGGAAAAALLPPPALRAGRDAPRTAPGAARLPRDARAARPRARRLLGAPDGLLSRALRARRSRVRSPDRPDRPDRRAAPQPPAARSDPPPERLEAEGTVALDRAGAALRLAAQYCPGSGRLRIRLLRAEGLGPGAEPRAVGCRVSLVLPPPGPVHQQRGAVLRRSRKAALEQDFCFEGLTEDQVRRLAVRVKAEDRGRGLERSRLLGRGELLLGSLLLL